MHRNAFSYSIVDLSITFSNMKLYYTKISDVFFFIGGMYFMQSLILFALSCFQA